MYPLSNQELRSHQRPRRTASTVCTVRPCLCWQTETPTNSCADANMYPLSSQQALNSQKNHFVHSSATYSTEQVTARYENSTTPRVRIQERLRVYIQNVSVYAGTTPTCVSTCADTHATPRPRPRPRPRPQPTNQPNKQTNKQTNQPNQPTNQPTNQQTNTHNKSTATRSR